VFALSATNPLGMRLLDRLEWALPELVKVYG